MPAKVLKRCIRKAIEVANTYLEELIGLIIANVGIQPSHRATLSEIGVRQAGHYCRDTSIDRCHFGNPGEIVNEKLCVNY